MGKKRINIAFKRYDLNYKNHQYCVLIPEHIDQLWVTSAGTPHWGVSFTANMDGLRALMYSFALLGFNPYNKIVYFPRFSCVCPGANTRSQSTTSVGLSPGNAPRRS